MKKYLYIFLGSLSVSLGLIGIFVPGLPTTPLLLLASWLFYNSSEKLHKRLHSSFLGKYLEKYQNDKGVSAKTKLISILMMCTMISISCIFMITNPTVRICVVIAGMIGLGCIIWVGPNEKK